MAVSSEDFLRAAVGLVRESYKLTPRRRAALQGLAGHYLSQAVRAWGCSPSAPVAQ